MGVFHPVYRVHSMGNNEDGAAEIDENNVKAQEAFDRMDQEPWSFGKKTEAISKAAVELRYQLMPLMYTAFYEYSQHGTPMLQPLSFYDQSDANCIKNENEFIFGGSLLVAPVVEAGIKKLSIYLPQGTWTDYWTGKTYAGQQTIKYKVSLATLPLFIKAGAVVPHYPIMQYTKAQPVDVLTLKVAYGTETNDSPLFEDAGEGYGYEGNDYSLKTYVTKGSDKQFTLSQTKYGQYADEYHKINIEVAGLPFKAKKCTVDGKAVLFKTTKKGLSLSCGNGFGELVIG